MKGFGKAFLKARWGRSMVGCCKLLAVRILWFCHCPHKSGHNIPINLQWGKCCSPCSALFYLYMNEKVLYPSRSEPWEWAVLYISGYRQHLKQKQKQWNTKVKVKEIDLIWSQTCSSLLHVLTDWQVISPEIPSTVVEFVQSSGLSVLFYFLLTILTPFYLAPIISNSFCIRFRMAE